MLIDGRTTARRALWSVQTEATEKRIEWLEKNAQDIARASGEPDWVKIMKEMARLARERGVNRRMTAAIKGSRAGLDRIEIPDHEWYYSVKTKEIYR